MSLAEGDFWAEADRELQKLAETFERNVDRVHPPYRKCKYGWGDYCTFCAHDVDYYEYRGPAVRNL